MAREAEWPAGHVPDTITTYYQKIDHLARVSHEFGVGGCNPQKSTADKVKLSLEVNF